MMPKTATYTAVRIAATTLILAEGSTTNLAVKMHLRQRGYEVYRMDISGILLEVAKQEGWTVEDWAVTNSNVTHVYHFPTLSLMAQ